MTILEKHKRRPGFFERNYIARNIEGIYTNFNITAQYDHRIDEALLSNALRAIILKNPSFAVNFYRDGDRSEDSKMNGNNFELRCVQKIDFEEVVEFFEMDTPFGEEQLTALDKRTCPMNDARPLWRVNVFECTSDKSQTLTFYCDHSLFDGTSGVNFHEDLIRELAALSEEDDLRFQGTLFDYSRDRELLPSLLDNSDKLVPLYKAPFIYSVVTIIKELLVPKWVKTLFNSFLNWNHPNTYKYPIFRHNPTRKGINTNHKLININPDQVQMLTSFCKSQKMTLSPYLSTIAMLSLQETVFPCISDQRRSFEIDFTINGRRYFPASLSQAKYGLYVAAVDVTIGPLPSPATFKAILPQMKYQSKLLSSAVEDHSPFYFTGLLAYINVWDFIQTKLGKLDSRRTAEISNLGNRIIHSRNWHVRNLWFSQSNGLSSHFCFSIISTKTGGLNLVVGFLDEVKALQTSRGNNAMDEFVEHFSSTLLQFAKDTPT